MDMSKLPISLESKHGILIIRPIKNNFKKFSYLINQL